MESANAEDGIDARRRRRTLLLGAHTARRRTDPATFIAADLVMRAGRRPTGNHPGRTLDATKLWTRLSGSTRGTHGATTRLPHRRRDPAAAHFAARGVALAAAYNRERQTASQHQRTNPCHGRLLLQELQFSPDTFKKSTQSSFVTSRRRCA